MKPLANEDYVVKLSRFYRSNNWRRILEAMFGLFVVGGTMLSLVALLVMLPDVEDATFYGEIRSRTPAFLALGLISIVVAYLIRLFICISRFAHELLIRFSGTDATVDKASIATQDDLRESFKSLRLHDLPWMWRIVVVSGSGTGAALLLLSVLMWLMPGIEGFCERNGLGLERTSLAGIALLATSGALMGIVGIVRPRPTVDRYVNGE